MPAAGPQRQLESPAPRRSPKIYARETAGLLVIGILVLILTVVRYWRHIPWGAR